MTGQQTRSVAIDLVRVVAIVAVVVRHNWYDPEGWVAQVICPWAIAIFFVLTGYLWSPHKRDVRGEALNRYRGLLIPYATWMLLIGVPYFIWLFNHFPDKHLEVVGLGAAAVYGAQLMVVPFSACWFFTTMFFTALLARYLERFPRWVTWALLGGMLVVTSVLPKILWYAPLGLLLAIPCLLFVVFGQELRRHRDRITRPGLTGLGLVAAGGLMVWLGASHDLDGELIEIKNSLYGFPVAGLVSGALIAVGLVLVAQSIDHLVPKALGPYITETASAATFIMFLHPVLLLLMNVEEEPWGDWTSFLVAWFVPYVLAIACLRLNILPWLTGVWGPRKPSRRTAVDQQAAEPS